MMPDITQKIGAYGPGSFLICGLAMLPSEGRVMIKEMIGRPLPSDDTFIVRDISFDGGEYGRIIAHLR